MAVDSEKIDQIRGNQDLREVQAVNLNHVLLSNFPCKDKYTTNTTHITVLRRAALSPMGMHVTRSGVIAPSIFTGLYLEFYHISSFMDLNQSIK